MSKIDESYHELLNNILQNGYLYDDPNRKGVQRLEIPSYTFKHKFSDGFPAITTKKLHYKNVVTELIWFLRGDTNIKYLLDNGCNIWNKDAYNYYLKNYTGVGGARLMSREEWLSEIGKFPKVGNLGPVYGKQWRDFNGVDQIANLIKGLKEKPLGTEHIVNSWNAGNLANMALPPCHYGFQIVVRPLSNIERFHNKDDPKEWGKDDIPQYGFELHWTQRSVDTFLGLPYNIASYATLALIIESLTGYKALGIQGDLKKVHLYDNSLDAVKEQLSRDVSKYNKCELNISKVVDIDITKYWNNLNMFIKRLKIEDFKLENYESYNAINVEMLERNN